MKNKQQRIKVVTDTNGVKTYYPQYKWLWLWFDFEDIWGCKTRFYDMQTARDFLDYEPVAKIEIIEN